MYLRIVSLLGLAALAGAGWAAPGDPSGASETDQSQSSTTSSSRDPRVQEPTIPPANRSTSTGQQDAQDQDGQARLVATNELIGRSVMTREGEKVGTLEYITLDLDQGNVSHLVVNTSDGELQSSSGTGGASASGPSTAPSDRQPASQSTGQQDGELIVMPWSIARIGDGDTITITATGHHLANAPRLDREQLNRLAEPAMAAYVVDYWAPASELAALEGQQERSQDGSQSQPQSDPKQSQQPQSQEQESPQMRDDSQMRDEMRSEERDRRLDQSSLSDQQRSRSEATSGLSGSAATDEPAESEPGATSTRQFSTSTDPSGGTSQSQAQDTQTQDEGQMVLVGQEVVTAVAPPMFQLSENLQGATVTDRNGEELGAIRRIMIDSDTGDAAFAVLESSTKGRAAVPLQSLEWTAKGTTLLSADPSALQSDEAIIEQPNQVDRDQLAQLYQRFDVEPYWQRSSSTGTSTRPTP